MPPKGPGDTISLPAPTGGWNTRDPLDGMAPEDAVQLDNWFPETGTVRMRGGSAEFADTTETDPVQTLFSYNGGGTSEMLAAAGGSIYDVTSGTVGAALATGYNSDVWSWTNHAGGGGTRLLAANASGLDDCWAYDGATITPLVLVGIAEAAVSQVMLYASRVFFVEGGTLSVWYTTAGAFQGAVTEFDFGPFCRKGGEIAAIGSWTRDSGDGSADDLFVVVTSEGEVLLYSGNDPANNWVLQGVFAVGKPVSGFRCLLKTGPDMVLICDDGVQPLSEYLLLGTTRASSTKLGAKISTAAQEAVSQYGTLAGWQGALYADQSMMLINVPQSATVFWQFVANTTTGAWCRFKGMNAYCWGTLGRDLYFGGADGTVYQALTGVGDSGSDVVAEYVGSYQYVGGRGANKRFVMCRPVLQTNGRLTYSLGVNVDYADTSVLPTVNSNTPIGALWGSGIWGTSLWKSSTMTLQRNWAGVSGIGYSVAVHMLVSTQTISVRMNSFDLMFEPGWAI